LARYSRGIDRLDRELIESVYWEDAIDCHGTFEGSVSQFLDWVIPHLAKEKSTMHFLGQSLIDIKGDKAVAETYFLARHDVSAHGGDRVRSHAGRYVDQLEKRGGEWRILNRRMLSDIRVMEDIGDFPPYTPIDPARTFGKTGRADPSYRVMESLG
jgi:SnoaL-like domain